MALKMKQVRNHGQDRRYHHPIIGFNGRLDTLQAGILLAKFEIFADEVEARNRIGQRYTELFNQLDNSLIITPGIETFNTSVYAQYTVQVEGREQIQEKLQAQGIPTAVHYPVPLHLQPAFCGLNQGVGSFPVAEAIAQRVMSLPMHPYLLQKDQDAIVVALQQAVLL